MPVNVVETLADLVAIPSVNPMGQEVSGPDYFEVRVTDYLEAFFERLGLPWQRQTVEPDRDNIIARLDGTSQGLIVFEAHQDTVPVEGMTVPPFEPAIRQGRLYGRGSCDIKGGMAAMLAALARLADERPPDMPTVVMACTVNEEYGFSGALALTQLWTPGADSLFARVPDGVIVAEPTLLNVVVAHRGIVRWRCHVDGRAAHSSQPHLGDNAIYKMSHVVQAIERYHNEVTPTLTRHPRCGNPTVCASTIAGGISVNTVPGHAVIEIDRRVVPGEDPNQAYDRLIAYIAEQAGVSGIRHEPPYRIFVGLSDDNNGPLGERLAAVARETEPGCQIMGVPYGTDAAVLAASGVPSVVFGPGSIDQAHTADEWLEISQLERAAEIYYRFAKQA